jgi:opacity protein-like surface antigen
MDSKKLFLRAGGYTVPTPVPDESMNPTLLDPNTRTIATLGVGLVMGKVTVDLAYERVMFGDKDLAASAYVFNATKGYQENFPGKYSFNANVFTLGVGLSL